MIIIMIGIENSMFDKNQILNFNKTADQEEDRFNRRSMVRLGVRVIHKITSETKVQPIVQPSPNKLSKSLRLRLSPKALKLTNKFSTSVDETQHRKLRDCNNAGGGSMSRIDMANHSTITTENRRQSKVRAIFIRFFFRLTFRTLSKGFMLSFVRL